MAWARQNGGGGDAEAYARRMAASLIEGQVSGTRVPARIHAGADGRPPLPGPPPRATRMAAAVAPERLRRLADDGVLYAVVDACDRADVPPLAWERGAGAASLYAATEDAALWAIAPYLFAVDGELLEWIEARRDDAWGVFAVADCGLEALGRHLSELLVVRSPDGERWRFRFYDPRVLPAFVESCDDEARRDFFGPASAFGVWTAEGARLLYAAPPRIRLVAAR